MQQPTQRRGSPISSQMSEAELAVDERINTALTSPRFTADAMTPSAVSYSIVREELESRSELNKSLSQEQALAFSSTARRNMHNASIKNDEDAKQASQSMVRLSDMVSNQGMTVESAVSQLAIEDPSRSLNSTYIKALAPFSGMVEDKHEKFMREHSQSISETKILTEGFDADMAYAIGSLDAKNMPALLEAVTKSKEAGEIHADTTLLEANIKNFQAAADFAAAKQETAFVPQAMARAGTGLMTNPDDHARMSNLFYKARVPIQDIGVFLTNANPSPNQLSFLTNPAMVAQIAADNDITPKEALAAVSNLGDEDLHGFADSGDRIAKSSISLGRRILTSGGAMFEDVNKNRLVSLQVQEVLQEENSVLSESFSKTTAAIRKVIADSNNIKYDPDVPEDHDEAFIKNKRIEAKDVGSAFLMTLAGERGISHSGELNDDEMRSMLKKAGDSSSLMSREKMSARGGELGLWMDVSNLPDGRDIYGKISADNFQYNLMSAIFKAMKPSPARVESTVSSGDFQDAPVPDPKKKAPIAPVPETPVKPGVAEDFNSGLQGYLQRATLSK